MACQYDQMCARLKAGIDGTVHGVQDIWDENSTMEDWVFLLVVDANNAFNEINRVVILWIVQHLWQYRDFFVFNCYFHWSLLVLRNGNGTATFFAQ